MIRLPLAFRVFMQVLTDYPPLLTGFTISPGSTSQGTTVMGTLTLNGKAPTSGSSIPGTCSNAQAAAFTLPVVIAGATSGNFAIL